MVKIYQFLNHQPLTQTNLYRHITVPGSDSDFSDSDRSSQNHYFRNQKELDDLVQNVFSEEQENETEELQLVDLTFCGPLKSAFNKECETFLKTHAAQKITPYDIAKLFNQAYGRVSSVEKATNGFKRNRIWPLNRNVYSDEDFMAAMNLSPPGEGSVLSLIDDDNQIEGTSQKLV
ncbi:hypothetical protein ANN_01903 [Periplaneta americana]|uniref:Uncharacterized protein n=1 Tax=Periplaneta americana TaxID=6978 RepID=A0ABQ8TUW9_PERAM|nr:hypothetical protein ANN_01903 [Periplaneta americana]